MTVINKMSQTLESLKSCETSCRSFAMDTDDQTAKQMYTQIANNVKQCVDMMQGRVDYVKDQEPQYQQQ